MEERRTTHRHDRGLWTHFGVLLGLAVVLFVGGRVLEVGLAGLGSGGTASALAELTRGLPQFLLLVVPVAAGLTMGAAVFSGRLLRHGVSLGVLSVVAMLLLDGVAAPVATRPHIGDLETVDALRVTPQRQVSAYDALGLPGAIAWFRDGERRARVGEIQTQYAADHPRVIAMRATERLFSFAIPWVLIGIVLGANAWLLRHADFREPADQRMATLMIAWVVVPLIGMILATWSASAQNAALRGRPLLFMAVPYIALMALAIVGWKSATQVAKEID
jgi:hypothetical protein